MRKIGIWAFVLCFTVSLFGQTNTGELRLKVTDPDGLGLKSTVDLTSEANQFRKTFSTDEAGNLTAKGLPFGLYRLQVRREGFSERFDSVDVRSAIPVERRFTLTVSAPPASVTVHDDSETLIDPRRTGTINRIGSAAIETQVASLPGRSVKDLVNSQPGWFYEGSAVLHPRGSEYQTQFVVDGIPLTDNRSPGFGPEIEAADVQSLSAYTAGIPAEYGRKLGGVVEVNTVRDTRSGVHGQIVLSGGNDAGWEPSRRSRRCELGSHGELIQ